MRATVWGEEWTLVPTDIALGVGMLAPTTVRLNWLFETPVEIPVFCDFSIVSECVAFRGASVPAAFLVAFLEDT